MKLLLRSDIVARLSATDTTKRLHVDPLLDGGQIGAVTLDLRLGVDFQVSLVTRRPSIDTTQTPSATDGGRTRGVESYFRPTRRDFGDRFIVYPGQVVLATTLEYIGLPHDVFADVLTRSSFNRLGIHLNTMVQPGFRGCFPLELYNHGNNPIELVVGGRMVQARLFEIDGEASYQSGPARKYYGNVRPVISMAQRDPDLALLAKVRGRGTRGP